ncbi:NADP-dependent oxidoreductase [Labilibacter marinus]|uniref:NADP-dependent oxidoreductase n=1 Tax=Labilibacter marinus TaxID=1477105 RepID=UPI00094FC268|nr:NADP-dependent oxidoreductase [Labilibacter marinus]
MKAIVLEKAGGVENLKIKDIEKPSLKSNEVLVETKAIGINPADWKVRSEEQALKMLIGATENVILGWDVAGVIAEVGNEVTGFKVGDKVFGMINFPGSGKAYAEYVAAPADQLAVLPEGTSFEEAAASTLAALTALQAITDRVKKDDRVLIHAGSGGVGHFAIQIGKSKGAYVLATSSAKNKDFVLSLGADEHIDYRTQKFEEVAADVDFVLDPMGGEVLLNSVKVMKEGGAIVSLAIFEVPADVKELADKVGVTVTPLLVKSNGDDMKTIADLLEAGTVKAHVSKTFSFENMGDVHNEVQSGRTVGKVVVSL